MITCWWTDVSGGLRHRYLRHPGWTSRMVLLAVVTVSGCGDSGPQPVHVQGHVTFRGEPIPAGSIVFESEARDAVGRMRSIAAIERGAYDTRIDGGTGVLPGTVRVFVEGYDGQPRETRVDEPSLGLPLFRPYRTVLTIDESASPVDIDVK